MHILVKLIASYKLMQYLLDTQKDSDSIISVNCFDAINIFLGDLEIKSGNPILTLVTTCCVYFIK
jgi:hypothetical protein